jgi:PQQ-dependent dehydrogenase (methanol/ethanol family)
MNRNTRVWPALLTTLLSAAVLAQGTDEPPSRQRPGNQTGPDRFPPVTDAMLEAPDDGDWLMWRRTLNGWGYSPLSDINRGNVGALTLAWQHEMAATGIQEATPLVYRGTMFLPNPSDVTQALDGATGKRIWEHRRVVPGDLMRYFSGAPLKNRNLAIYGDTIIDLSVDDFVYALDARTGEPRWETRVQDYRQLPAIQGSGPIVARGKILSGRACDYRYSAEGCAITAHDARTGRELWRFFTIPRPGEPGDESWGGVPYERRRHVGAWMPPSYDPALNLLYIGTSVTSPAPKFLLGGNDKQHLYHNSTLAIDADTGKLRWHYQHVVDHWDLDHPFERILVDTAVAPDPRDVAWINPRVARGERRSVVTGIPGKTGIVYTLDRRTGEFLWARPTNFQNVVSRIDGATGAAVVNPESLFTRANEERLICPNTNGGKNWPAGAYSPLKNAIFMPVQNTCAIESVTADAIPPAGVTSAYMIRFERQQLPPGVSHVGTIHAVSVETGRTLWTFDNPAGVLSLMTTAGGLVFGGDVSGNFRALDQDTGKVLWTTNLGSPVNGFPVSYRANGRQYIAVSTGTSLVSAGVGRLAGEQAKSNANNLYVFALP